VEDESLALTKGYASRKWYQSVADRVFPKCKHTDCEKLGVN
jgi:hypothetical protein